MTRRPLLPAVALATALLAAAAAGCGRERAAREATQADRPAPAAAPARRDTTGGTEAAAAHILVWYRGCKDAPDTVSRTRSAAEDRARRIAVLAREPGADFAELARRYSDDPLAARSGGYLGIVQRGELDLAFELALFALAPGEVSHVVETEYGWHVIQRQAIRRAHARHILIAWRGAERATEAVTRTKEQARALAAEVRLRAAAPDADLCTLARQFSDDAGNSTECGDLGVVLPGWLPADLEAELFRLRPGQVSPVVESPFGFHIAWRDS